MARSIVEFTIQLNDDKYNSLRTILSAFAQANAGTTIQIRRKSEETITS